MNFVVHNNLHENSQKISKTAQYYCYSALRRYPSQKWDIEVWVNQNRNGQRHKVTCGISLKRPGQCNLYVKKIAQDYRESIKRSFSVLHNIIKKDRLSWNRANKLLLGKLLIASEASLNEEML